MKDEDKNRFPQRRNGVTHPSYGMGVVLRRHNDTCAVQFADQAEEVYVDANTLESIPALSISPDPKTHRRSGYVGGNNYRSRK